jgi:type IV secretory pathway VirB10-like protein
LAQHKFGRATVFDVSDVGFRTRLNGKRTGLTGTHRINEATQQIVRKELQLQPTIRVAPGARFAVFTAKDLSIPPYTG